MGLRVLLVAVVVCLGLELPNADDLSTWKVAGRDWLTNRVADFSKSWSETTHSSRETSPVESASGRVDLAFEAVVEGMASGFSADLVASRSSPSSAVEDPEPVVVEAPASRSEKIITAVRLTMQAVDAWASLIQPSGDEPVETDSH